MRRMRDGNGYSCVFVCFFIVILIVINTVPAIFFYLTSTKEESESTQQELQDNISGLCDVQKVQSGGSFVAFKHDFLLSSACQSYLPWIVDFSYDIDQSNSTSSDIIAIDNGCGLQRTEKDLKNLFHFKSLLSERCASHGLPFLCSYFYRPSVNGTLCNKQWPTRDECEAVKSVHCKSEWKVVETVQQSRDYCIRLPDCRQLPFRHQKERRRKLENETSCNLPLISSDSNVHGCSPSCPAYEWLIREKILSGITATTVICLVVIYTSSFIVFYTWARVKELRKFPHTITLLTTVLFLTSVSTYSIVFVVGRRTAYCSHKDVFGTWLNPTQFCVAQGAVFHFTFIAGLVMFTMSIFNFLVAIKDRKNLNEPGILNRHSKLILAVEVFTAFGVASVVMCAVISNGSYHNDFLQVMCIPKSSRARFYSVTVPSQVTGVIGIVMTTLIIKRMKQSSDFQAKHGAANSKAKAAGVIITRHFLVLVTGAPLTFVIGFSILEVYDYFWFEDTINAVTDYILCQQTNGSSNCISLVDDVGLAVVHCIVPVCYTTFTFLLMIYSLFPGPARKLWARHFRTLFLSSTRNKSNCQKAFRRQDDGSRKILRNDNCRIDLNGETPEQCVDEKSSTNVKETGNRNFCRITNEENIGCAMEIRSENNSPKRADGNERQESHFLEGNQGNSETFDTLIEVQEVVENAVGKKSQKINEVPKILRKIIPVRELQKTEPVTERLMGAVAVGQKKKRASSLGEFMINSRFIKRKMRRATVALDTLENDEKMFNSVYTLYSDHQVLQKVV